MKLYRANKSPDKEDALGEWRLSHQGGSAIFLPRKTGSSNDPDFPFQSYLFQAKK